MHDIKMSGNTDQYIYNALLPHMQSGTHTSWEYV